MLKRAAILAIIIFSAAARAESGRDSEDGLVVERSDLIVVAHIKEGSIEGGPQGALGVTATLVIEEVLKGAISERETVFTLNNCHLNFSIGGKNPSSKLPHSHYAGAGKFMPAAGVIALHCNFDDTLISTHLEASKIWLLRQNTADMGEKVGAERFGLAEFDEIQELELKDYYKAYLSEDPAASVRAYVATRPQLLARARPYLDHTTVQRIREIPDLHDCARRLTPYVMTGQFWSNDREAQYALAACRDVGGALLVPLYTDPALEDYRIEIIEVFGASRYKPTVDLLTAILTRFVTPGSGHVYYREAATAIQAMQKIDDPRARDLVNVAETRWNNMRGR